MTLYASEQLQAMADTAEEALAQLQGIARTENAKQLNLRFTSTKAAELAGLSHSDLRTLQHKGKVSRPDAEANNRAVYSLQDINEIRDVAGTRPSKPAGQSAPVIAVQNFKGGVGKSTLGVHLSQYFALQGYRALLIDCDSQASCTTYFGYNPDLDVQAEETILPFLLNEDGFEDLRQVITPTYWPGVDLIRACLPLYEAEYLVANELALSTGNAGKVLHRLRAAIADVSDEYDVIIVDPPPALGMISMSVLSAATALLIPSPPSILDFASTTQFLSMAASTLNQLEAYTSETPSYDWVRILPTKTDLRKSAQSFLMDNVLKPRFGEVVLQTPLFLSAEFESAAITLESVYEVASTSSETRTRCIANLNEAFSAIETLISKVWQERLSNAA